MLIGHSFGGLIVQYYIANFGKDSGGSKLSKVLLILKHLDNEYDTKILFLALYARLLLKILAI